MKKVTNCVVENCIPTPSSCVQWNGSDIPYLGICTGDFLNQMLLEIVDKLQNIAGEDLTQFDIDSLLDICNQKAPVEVTLISILTVIKNNQVCLKDFIDTLSSQIADLNQESTININLKCYAQFDNQGNSLSITREELDQLVINELCDHEKRLDSVEGKIIEIQEQINDVSQNVTVDELTFATCVDAGVKPTSSQVIAVAEAHCDLEAATGTPGTIATALSKIPGDWNSKYSTVTGWDTTPANFAEAFGNALLVINNLEDRIKNIEDNCCALSCDDVKVGFVATFNSDSSGIILKFTSGAGTNLPSGFTDDGSYGTVTDADGNEDSFTVAITNGAEVEIPISGINLTGDVTVSLIAKVSNGTISCEKYMSKILKPGAGCAYCEISATCAEGDTTSYAIITYEYPTLKSIRVNCGDTTILPIGAKNVKIVKNGSITLSGECVLSTATETTFGCYSLVFVEANGAGGVQAYEDIWFDGVIFDGVKYPFTSTNLDIVSGAVVPDGDQLITLITSAVPALSGLLIEPCTDLLTDGDTGDRYAYIFKTTPEIANKLMVITHGEGVGGSGNYTFYTPVLQVAQQTGFVAGIWNPICGCKTS